MVLDLLQNHIGSVVAPAALIGYPCVEGGRIQNVSGVRQELVSSRICCYLSPLEWRTLSCLPSPSMEWFPKSSLFSFHCGRTGGYM